jgi:microcystin-dependent protein
MATNIINFKNNIETIFQNKLVKDNEDFYSIFTLDVPNKRVGINITSPQEDLHLTTLRLTNIVNPTSINIANTTTTVNLGLASTTINIGTTDSVNKTINIGQPGDIINIAGTLATINTTNTDIQDSNIILNKGGLTNSAGNSGISFEENNVITGYIKIDSNRNKFNLKVPANNFVLDTPVITQNEIISTENFVRTWLPIGAIIMWSGNSVPTGWGICDGTNYVRTDGAGNLTSPDLRGRFIVSTGNNGVNNYSTGNTGGSDSITLTTNNMPAHTHTGTTDACGNHTHTVSNTVQSGSTNTGKEFDDQTGGNPSEIDLINTYSTTTSTNGSHIHTFTTDSTGSGQAFDNRPLFYALAYIIKI